MVDVRNCRECDFRVARAALTCPRCQTRRPGYTARELLTRRLIWWASVIAALVTIFVKWRNSGP